MRLQSLGEFEELVLLVVASLQNEGYGVTIHESLMLALSKNINISAVHMALRRLEEKDFVKSGFGGITEDRGGRRKRYYEITAAGKRALDKQYELRVSLYQQLPKISYNR